MQYSERELREMARARTEELLQSVQTEPLEKILEKVDTIRALLRRAKYQEGCALGEAKAAKKWLDEPETNLIENYGGA